VFLSSRRRAVLWVLLCAGASLPPNNIVAQAGRLPDSRDVTVVNPPAQKKTPPTTETTEQFWYGLTPDRETAFRLVTDFNLKQIAPDRSYSHQVSARVTPVHPATDKSAAMKAAFAKDWDFSNSTRRLAKKTPLSFIANSIEYRWNVAQPGKDVLYLKPKKEILLEDRNRLFSLFVRGAGHAHQVFAIFRGPNKLQQEIFVCSLDYKGWKRFEVVIPPYLRLRNPLKHNAFELWFVGLKVASYFRDQPGMSVFNLAGMFVVADTSDRLIPGADMKDNF